MCVHARMHAYIRHIGTPLGVGGGVTGSLVTQNLNNGYVYVCMSAYMYVCMYVCIYVCMRVCVCMHAYICVHACMLPL